MIDFGNLSTFFSHRSALMAHILDLLGLAFLAFAVIFSMNTPKDPPAAAPVGIVDCRGSTYQYAFDYDASPQNGYQRCAWAVTPCGRPTNIRAYGDVQ